MLHKFLGIMAVILTITLLSSACTPTIAQSIPTATLIATPDPCSNANISAGIQRINILMREFDDDTFVASMTPKEQLSVLILNLQDVRRRTDTNNPPACIAKLQSMAVNYMNEVILFMAHSMGGVAVSQVDIERTNSLSLRNAYEEEYAHMTGVAYISPTPLPTVQVAEILPTDTPTPTQTATQNNENPTETETTEVIVTNPGPLTINLHDAPDISARLVGFLNPQENAEAIARTNSGDWILISYSKAMGGSGWVSAKLVQTDHSIEPLPISGQTATPNP
ncbi:MAG TPA: SH3 domain-containing protein [Anaerolineaceae bacterium]|nr:SH3 domain-containing protein [Anaerolineaceae bacterium]